MATPVSVSSPPRSPARSPGFSSPLPVEGPKESAIARFFIAPLTFASFLISLAIIDSRNHRLRAHEHAAPRPDPVGAWQHLKYYLHAIVYKEVDGSPYAYVKSPKSAEFLAPQGQGRRERSRGKEGEREPWHWHTKQRHMMKREMDEAFRLRQWVVVVLVGGAVVALFVGGMAWRWVGRMIGGGM